MPRLLFCDLETYSDIPINSGTHRYAENAEILLFAYAYSHGSVKVWDMTQDKTMPADLKTSRVSHKTNLGTLIKHGYAQQ